MSDAESESRLIVVAGDRVKAIFLGFEVVLLCCFEADARLSIRDSNSRFGSCVEF